MRDLRCVLQPVNATYEPVNAKLIDRKISNSFPMKNIGVWAPSRCAEQYIEKINEGILRLKNSGFKIVSGKTVFGKYMNSSGSITDRINDLIELWSNNAIDTIWCALGGDTANQLLPHLPFDLMSSLPKNIVGFSDTTHIIWAVNKYSNITTFHGPNVKDLAGISDDSWNWNLELLNGSKNKAAYPNNWQVLRHGRVESRMYAGNLFVVNALSATRFLPDLEGAILCLEDIDDGLMAVEYQLYLLSLTGILDKIGGLVVGHIVEDIGKTERRPVLDIVGEIVKPYKFPVIKVDYFGHETNDFYIMPQGINALLDTYKNIFQVGG